jgi:hypothetical protein
LLPVLLSYFLPPSVFLPPAILVGPSVRPSVRPFFHVPPSFLGII